MPRSRALAWPGLDAATTEAIVSATATELTLGRLPFTARNLYYAARARARSLGAADAPAFDVFKTGVLAAALRREPLPLLLRPRGAPRGDERLPSEWDAYFPAAILLVDRPSVLDLFVASGVLVQGRIAVVCVDGTPGGVVDWLVRGFRAGHRAPLGYLHDAATVVHPFSLEPVATMVRVARGGPLPYGDLGLPPRGLDAGRFAHVPRGRAAERVVALEALPPAALVTYATRRLLAMIAPDPWLAPPRPDEPAHAPRRTKGASRRDGPR